MKCRSAIVVPCHGVCMDPLRADQDAAWRGAYQNEGPLYVEHISAGVAACAAEPAAVLIFSGGMTREEAGRRSEAESYRAIADQAAWYGHSAVRDRTLLEAYARDSLENLAFSLACFRGALGYYPTMVSVLGWKFKEARFELHRQALKWPRPRFAYIGFNNPPEGPALEAANAGEAAKLAAVRQDLYLHGHEWQTQRAIRDPFHRQHPYRTSAPELAEFFRFLDGDTFYGTLPWCGVPGEPTDLWR